MIKIKCVDWTSRISAVSEKRFSSLIRQQCKGLISKSAWLTITALLCSVLITAQYPTGPYERIQPITNGYSIVYLNGKVGMLNDRGKLILPAVYDHVDAFVDGYAWIYKATKKGMMKEDGTIVIEAIYDEISGFDNEQALVNKNGKIGIISKEGLLLVPAKYEKVELFDDSLAWVWSNGNLGLVALGGEVLIAPKYDYIVPLENGQMRLEKTGCTWIWERGKKPVKQTSEINETSNYPFIIHALAPSHICTRL